MVRTDLIRGKIAEKGLSGIKMSKILNIAPKTFYSKMKSGVFTSVEMQKMVDVLGIKNPNEIFFAKEVTHDVTLLDS